MDANNPQTNFDPNQPAPTISPNPTATPQTGVTGAQVIEPGMAGAPAVAATAAPVTPSPIVEPAVAPSVDAQPLSGVTAPMDGSDIPMPAPAATVSPSTPNPIPGAADVPPSAPNAVYPEPGAPAVTGAPGAPVDVPMGKPAAFMDPNHQPKPGVGGGKSGKGKIAKVLLIVLALLIAVGGGGAYAFVSTQKNKPENVTALALANLISSKQTATDGAVTITDLANKNGLEIGFTAKQDGKNAEASISIKNVKTEVLSFDAAKLGITVRLVDDNAYFRIDNLKAFVNSVYNAASELVDPALVESYKPLKDQIEAVADKLGGKWVEAPKSTLEANDLDCVPDPSEVTASEKKQIATLYKQHKFVTIKANHGIETLDGTKTNHYTAVLNTGKMDTFGDELAKLNFAKKLGACLDTANQENTKSTEGADAPLTEKAAVGPKVGDIDYWVSKDKRLLTKLSVPFSSDDMSAKVEASMKYGEDVKIEKPKDIMTLDEFMALYEKAIVDAGLGDGASPLSSGQGGISGIVNGLRTDIPNIIQR